MLSTLHAMLTLGLVELLIRWVPLPRLSQLLGVRVNLQPTGDDVEQLDVTALSAQDRMQLRSARRVTNAWPFSKGPCLRRSLVAGHLLRDHHPAIRLGVIGSGDELSAHAWLEIDGRPLESVERYQAFAQASATTVQAAPR